jgi:6-phosphofructokinase 2
MVHALCRGDSELEAFRRGMAAGSAAVLRAGTDLARPADIERMLERIEPL